MKLITRAMAVACAVTMAASSPAKADGVNLNTAASPDLLTATGSSVTITFLHSIAGFSNELRLFMAIGGSSQVVVFDVLGLWPAQGSANPAGPVVIGGLTPGQTLAFGICTNAVGAPAYSACNTAGRPGVWWSGAASNNAAGDGQLHSALLTASAYNILRAAAGNVGFAAPAGTMVMGFEDTFGRGDGDYSDLVFSLSGVTSVPEPGTMGLLALGLVGLSGAGLVRRRRTAKRDK